MYSPADVPSSVGISRSKYILCWLFWSYASGVHYSAQRREVCEYTCPASKSRIAEDWSKALFPGGEGGIPGGDGVSAGVGSLRQLGGDAVIALRLQHICGFFVVPFCQVRHPSMWFWCSVARCLSIAAFSFLCPGNTTPRFFSSQSFMGGFWIRYCVATIAAPENSPSAIFAIFKRGAHVGLFQLYATSLPCHSRRHVENIQEFSCCDNHESWLLLRPYMLQ